ncbi:MAG: SagB family peptide dehydrogenase [Pseudomonadota bacterium]
MEFSLQLSLIDDLNIKDGEDEGLLVLEMPPQAHRGLVRLKQVTPTLAALLRSLQGGMATVPGLIGQAMQSDGPGGIAKINHYLQTAGRNALLCFSAVGDETPLATIEPRCAYFHFKEGAVDAESAYVLSKFALLRALDGGLVLECPTGYARIRIHDSRMCSVVNALSRPHTSAELAAAFPDLGEDGIGAFLTLLVNANALVTSDDGNAEPEAQDPVMAQWEFHDLVFHARARLGRHADPYGGTFPFMDRFEAPPPVKPRLSEEVVELYTPDLDALKTSDLSFTEVLEGRQSLRDQGDPPITVEQLGEFLYRTARIKGLAEDAGVSWRPSPGGGAIHELDIYPLVSNCTGLANGLYHYNAREHLLSKASEPSPLTGMLAQLGGITARLDAPPQVLLLVTARFQRIQIKYQSMTYAVILKNVGALYQTFYLVATAMNLSPCALGGGHADLFNQITGLNYYEETTVGEFILTSRPPEAD